jgi:hypothetical protein
MKIKIKIKMLSILVVIACFSSCSKDESENFDPETGSFKGRVQKVVITSITESETAEYEFTYDEKGFVTEILHPVLDNGFQPSETFTRNSDGRIVVYDMKSYYYLNGTSFKNYNEYYDYTIGSDGKYVSANVTIKSGSNITKLMEVYKYSGNRITQIVSDRNPDKNSTYHDKTNSYKYDNKGNVTRIETVYADNDGEYPEIVENTYDNKTFPITSINAPFSLGTASWEDNIYSKLLYNSTNNLLSAKYTMDDGIYTESRKYSYDKSSKPINVDIYLGDSKGNSAHFLSVEYIYF